MAGSRGKRHAARGWLGWCLGAVLMLSFLNGTPVVHADPTRYGADLAKVQAAVNAAGWPQQQSVWCGLAALDAVVNFRGYALNQYAMADVLRTAAAKSAWGTPDPDPSIAWGPGFPADISRDVGTDPRSIAVGETLGGHGSYHVVVDRISAQDATYHMVADLVRTQEPIHVIVFRGGHSVIVSGVYATDDPVKDPQSITALEVWDPGFGIYHGNIQGSQMTVVPIDEWFSNRYYWSSPYDEDLHGTIAQDPDPAVGPYAYNPDAGDTAHLWVGNYVYIRPDAPGDATTGVSQDWEFNQEVSLIQGEHGEMPQGYTGNAVNMTDDTLVQTAPTATATPGKGTGQGTGSSSGSGSDNSGLWSRLCDKNRCTQLADESWHIVAVVAGLLVLLGILLLFSTLRGEVTAKRRRSQVADTIKLRRIEASRLWDGLPPEDPWLEDETQTQAQVPLQTDDAGVPQQRARW